MYPLKVNIQEVGESINREFETAENWTVAENKLGLWMGNRFIADQDKIRILLEVGKRVEEKFGEKELFAFCDATQRYRVGIIKSLKQQRD